MVMSCRSRGVKPVETGSRRDEARQPDHQQQPRGQVRDPIRRHLGQTRGDG
jgi:hypothetical protein